MDTRTGVFRRRGQFIWYYQITEPATYLRNVTSYLTHTASLRVSYNNTASTTEKTELPDIGTPRQVEELRSYLESRIRPSGWSSGDRGPSRLAGQEPIGSPA